MRIISREICAIMPVTKFFHNQAKGGIDMRRRYIKLVILAVLLTLLLWGCAETQKMNRLSIGMTKGEVISTMGREPNSISAQGEIEYLQYSLWRDIWDRRPGDYSDPFFVRLKNGRVESFGRVGDFDSTKVPEIKETVDLKIKN